jgi:molybdopterin molybdotransferase
MLMALAEQAGAIAETRVATRDETDALASSLQGALSVADIVLVTGGVSAGTLDLVPHVLEQLGVERIFHKVRVKPGKPLWFGVGPARPDGPRPLVFGLPGNPVSGLVGFLLFVRPAIEALSGHLAEADRTIEATLSGPFVHRGDRPTYHPARRTQERPPEVEPLDWAGSADLRAVAGADGFAVFPPGDRSFEAGEIVRFLPLD